MSLRLAILQHERETGLGRFEALLDAAGVTYDIVTSTREPLPDAAAFDGAVVLGASLDPHDATLISAKRWIRRAVSNGLPYLGVCLGAQLLGEALGAHVRRSLPELGIHDVFLTDAARLDPLFADLPGRLQVFGWHTYGFELPHGALPLAGSLSYTYEAFRWGDAYGLQFHPEVRPDDLERWLYAPGNRRLLAAGGRDWLDVAAELERAAPELDELAAKLLERWLGLVAAAAVAPPAVAARSSS
jgi:GMP synthase (glutamine-hydrolysing)